MASTYLSRTLGAATNRKKFTLSFWFKRSKLDQQYLWQSFYSSNFGYRFGIYFNSDNTLHFKGVDGGSTHTFFGTNRVFRDTNAWYHLYIGVDSTQATESDRFKIYVNGVQETSFSSSTYPNQNRDFALGVDGSINYLLYIGRYGNSSSNYFDGSMSHFHYVDGSVIAHTQFGSTDSTTGEWKINTSPTISSYGTAGFLILKDGMTKTEDCPSNVFATLNPLEYSPNPATLDNGNTTYNKSSTGSGHNATATGTIGAMTGKWYYEFKPTNTTAFVTGMVRTNHVLPDAEGYFGNDAGGYGVTKTGRMVAGSESSVTGLSIGANDIVGLAFDLDNGKFYVHVNGTYMLSGDPTSGSTGTGSLGNIALGSNIYVPYVANANYGATNLQYFNFGNGYFGTTAVSSAGTNASGNGIFEYDVPTGYTALSTKGLNL